MFSILVVKNGVSVKSSIPMSQGEADRVAARLRAAAFRSDNVVEVYVSNDMRLDISADAIDDMLSLI